MMVRVRGLSLEEHLELLMVRQLTKMGSLLEHAFVWLDFQMDLPMGWLMEVEMGHEWGFW